MPTRAGIPVSPAYQGGGPGWIGSLNQFNWVDVGGNEALGVAQNAAMRGHPEALAWWQQRTIRGPQTVPQPTPVYFTSRPYSRGAEAHAPKFGQLAWNPIGAGIPSAYKLPVIAGPGARYVFGAIWFDVQSIGTSLRINPTIPIETVQALIATSSVGPSYLTTG
jgi:hypothetical protein